MKLFYGIRLILATMIGLILSISWLFFSFDGGGEAMSPKLKDLSWNGVWHIQAAWLICLGFSLILASSTIKPLYWLSLKYLRFIHPEVLANLWEEWIGRLHSKGPFLFLLMLVSYLLLIGGGFVLFFGTLFFILEPTYEVMSWLAKNTWVSPKNTTGISPIWESWKNFFHDEDTKGVFWIYFKGLAISLFLFYFPVKWVVFRERFSESPLLRRLFVQGKGGSARWAGPQSYKKHSYDPTGGVFLGRPRFLDAGPQIGGGISFNDDSHMLTIGCTGSGKSVTAIWPNLASYGGGAIVLDPKGEHASMTYWTRSASQSVMGQSPRYTKNHFKRGKRLSYKLDPFNEEPSIPGDNYNPLSEIDLSDDRCRESLAAISDGCVLSEGDKNRHWTEGSKTILEGIIAHVLSEYPKENHNLPFVYDLLVEFDPEFGIADPNRLDEVLIQMKANNAAGGICSQASSLLGDRQGEGYKNMMATVHRSIKWMSDPAMRKHLCGPEKEGHDRSSYRRNFSFKNLPGHRDTLYIVSPLGPIMKEQVRWIRVLTNFGLTIVRKQPKPNISTLCILDEFPQLGGQLSAIEEGIVTLRSAGVKLWVFIQQIGQMKKDYGASWNTFVSSSNVQAFGVTDPETAEWLSGFLGEYLHTRKEKKRIVHEGTRPLWTKQEIMSELGKSKPLSLVIPNDGGFPMILERISYKPLKIEGNIFRSSFSFLHTFEEKI